jgi:hypothetical protein
VITDVSYKEWDGWGTGRFPANHFYQTYEWFHVLTSTWDDLEIRIRSFEENEALPVFARKMGPIVLEGSPLRGYFTPYGGYLGNSHISHIEELLWGDFSEACLPPPRDDHQKFWNASKTVILDLRQGTDAIWKAMKTETRKQIKKAMHSNVEIRQCSGSEWVDTAYEIFIKTYTRQHLSPPAPKRFYSQIAAVLPPESLKVFMAYYEGKPVAYSIIGLHDRTIYGVDGGLDRDYQHVRPKNLLHWHIIQWAIGQGYASYDMVGGNIESIAAFKLGFGGLLTEYSTVEFTPTILGKVAWHGYTMFRPVIKELILLINALFFQ